VRNETVHSTEAVEAGVRFLADRQLPSGAFSVRRGFDLSTEGTEADGHALFATAMVAHSLGFCDLPAAEGMRGRAAAHLLGHMEPGGVWRHWTAGHPQYHWLPSDLDDTASISSVLRSAGVPIPDNTGLLLANRDPRGLFYTWLIARWPPPLQRGYWRAVARRLRRPLQARRFWRTSAAPDDVDAVVNANLVQYLGDGPHAGPVVDHLLGVLRDGTEDRCDKWYRSPFVFHYALSRCARAGVSGLEPARELVCARIRAAAGADGRIGDGPLDTALAVCSLADWAAAGAEGERACGYLAATQSAGGSWPAEALYFGGPRGARRVPAWGSEELTSALCVEALARVGR
jgi:hypothetical protein